MPSLGEADTEIFSLISWCHENGPCYVYFLIPITPPHTEIQHRFYLVDRSYPLMCLLMLLKIFFIRIPTPFSAGSLKFLIYSFATYFPFFMLLNNGLRYLLVHSIYWAPTMHHVCCWIPVTKRNKTDIVFILVEIRSLNIKHLLSDVPQL